MEKLLKGVVQFKKEDFEQHKELFKNLGKEQKPHTLFIGCSDSRVVPTLITKTLPGELFIIRNIANIIPPYRIREEYLSTTSAIEYAVKRLNIKAVIVCGHSNCGGCAALYQPPEELADIPNVQKWLELFEEIPEKVKEKLGSLDDPAAREWLTEQMNVVKQMKHLMTYPFIREKYKKREIQIYGWHYIIETGEIFQYDPDKNCFELISPGEEKS